MGTAAFILACFAGLTTMALFVAVLGALLTMDDREMAEINHRLSLRPQKGWRNQWRNYQWLRHQIQPPTQILQHWRARPEARRLFYWMLLFLALTCILGQLAQRPHP